MAITSKVHLCTVKKCCLTEETPIFMFYVGVRNKIGYVQLSPVPLSIMAFQKDGHASTLYLLWIASILFSMTQQPLVSQGILFIDASRSRSDIQHSVLLLWTSDQPDVEASY